MRRRARLAALIGVIGVLLGGSLLTAAPVGDAAQSCQTYQVRSPWPGAYSRFLRVDLPSGATTAIGVLHRSINAIGYSAAQGLVYGLTGNGDVVTVDTDGRDTDLGPTRDASGRVERLWDAAAGTVSGDSLYVGDGAALYTVDIQPGADYLRIVAWTALWPEWISATLEDFDRDSTTGVFYGVADVGPGQAGLVSVDPDTGRITVLSRTLPPGDYGAVTVGPDGALYALANDLRGRSVEFRIPLPSGEDPTSADAGPAVADSDATGCLPAALPPPTSPPAPPPTTPAAPPPALKHPAPAVPHPTTPNPTVTTTPASPTATQQTASAPLPPMPSGPLPTAAAETNPVRETAEVAKQRRWGLTVLVLIIGGAAAVRGMRTRRHR